MLTITQDEQRGTVTVDGIVYAQELLRDLAVTLPIGQPFTLMERRDDGLLVVRRLGQIQWPAGLLERIKAAEQRVQDNRAPRSIPADPHSDVDLVLAEVRYLIEGTWPPFWLEPSDGVKGHDHG